MKDKKNSGAVEELSTGQVKFYAIGTDLRFGIAGKKGKQKLFRIESTHPLFSLLSDAVLHAHRTDRKLSVESGADDGVVSLVKAIHVGSHAKPKKARNKPAAPATESKLEKTLPA
jgi:hypothetical protein